MNLLNPSLQFSNRTNHIRTSCVRQIMNKLDNSNAILFTAGLPHPEMFPADELSKATQSVLRQNPASALQYASTQGYEPLRQYIAEKFLRPRSINANADEIIITNGSQQGLDLIAKVFIDEHCPVLVESPTYMAALQAFDLWNPAYLSTPMTEHGICPDAVERILQQAPVRLMYTVSSFHNPTGQSYSAHTAKKLARVLKRHNTILVEDNPYSELFYDQKPTQFISSMCPEQAVVLGSFSKILAPGLRMGWIWAPQPITQRLLKVKQGTDLCSNVLTQRILHRYLEMFSLENHTQKLRRFYRPKRDFFLEQLKRIMPEDVSWTTPAGGMFVWLTLPDGMDAHTLLEHTMKQGVAFAPGESFFAVNPQKNTMRLNFTHSDCKQVQQGLAIIAENINKQRCCIF